MLVSVSTTGGATALRMHVWRKLKSLGALYLQSSVCLLPNRPPVAREVHRLADRVHRDGGTARVLQVLLPDPAQQDALRGELNAARDGEYAEILERVPAFLDELSRERSRNRATYEEVEESEADLTRFRAWLNKIEARDYFGAPGRQAASDAVQQCAADLAAFEVEALANEGPPGPRARHLREVPGIEQARAAEATGAPT